MINNQKTYLLAIELVDMFEIEDLEINLVDKRLYQLINKTNNAKYYHN